METAIWERLRNIPSFKSVQVAGRKSGFLLLPIEQFIGTDQPCFWLVGEYRYLTGPATKLRANQTLQKFVVEQRVRFGLRDKDYPPKGIARQKNFGTKTLAGDANKTYWDKRTNALSKAAKLDQPMPGNRETDLYPEVKSFWLTQTAQAHHVVEYSTLAGIGVSKEGNGSELDKGRLPCVLLMAEFHQCYVTSVLKRLHDRSKNYLLKEMDGAYHEAYTKRCPPLDPLWTVSQIILEEARKFLK